MDYAVYNILYMEAVKKAKTRKHDINIEDLEALTKISSSLPHDSNRKKGNKPR